MAFIKPLFFMIILDERRERRRLIAFVPGEVMDHAAVKVDLDLIASLDRITGLLTFEDRQTDVDRVAIEDTGKGLGDDAADAAFLDGDRRMLTG